jgi:hypothetical protein
MPKRTSKETAPYKPIDVNQTPNLLMQQSTEEKQPEEFLPTRPLVPKAVSRVMAQMGRKGGKIGGKRRLEKMTPEHRSQVASIAAKARWAKKK